MIVLLFALVFRNVVAGPESEKSIQQKFPIRIDHILLVNNSVMMNTSIISGNIQQKQHSIKFLVQMKSDPEIVIGIGRIYWLNNAPDSINLALQAKDKTRTGFILHSNMEANTYYTLFLSYFAFCSGYGIQKQQFKYPNPSVFLDDTDLTKMEFSSVLTFFQTGFGDPLFSQKNHYAIYREQIEMIAMIPDSQTQVKIQPQSNTQIKVSFLLYEQNNVLTSFRFNIIVLIYETFQNNLASNDITGYIVDFKTITNVLSIWSHLYRNDNKSTYAYSIVGMKEGPLGINYTIGFDIEENWWKGIVLLDEYNSEDLKYKNDFKSISSQTTKTWQFSIIRYYRNNCDAALPKLKMKQQVCYESCPRGTYSDSDNRCNQCCGDCTNLDDCKQQCIINACYDDHFFDYQRAPPFRCISCQDIQANCSKCNVTTCFDCFVSSKQVYIDGFCYSCNSTYFFKASTKSCQLCWDYNTKCLQCQNTTYCNECFEGYSLVNGICIPQLFDFNIQIWEIKNTQNAIVALLSFQGNMTLANIRYTFKTFINKQQCEYQSVLFPENESIVLTITFNYTVKQPNLSIKFYNTTVFQSLLNTEKTTSLGKLFFLNPTQYEVYSFLGGGMAVFQNNSGSLISSFSATSLMGYFIGILWNFQIASFYIFLQVQKPKNLMLFLNTSFQTQNIQLLPFQIPSIYQRFDISVDVNSNNKIYETYDFDLFFFRSNFIEIVSLLLITIIWYLMYLVFKRINFNCKSGILKYLRNKIVNQVYSNITMYYYSVITVVAFTASATLSTKLFDTKRLMINYFGGFLGMTFCLGITILNPVILFKVKKEKEWDTEQLYIGIKKSKYYSEIALMVYLFYQLLIAVMIPLFHPIFTLTVLIAFSLANVIMLIKLPILEIRICIYYRIAGQIMFIIFNFMFLALYIIQHYYPEVELTSLLTIGYIAIGSISMVIFLQLIQMITQIVVQATKFIKKKCYKQTRPSIHQYQTKPMQTQKSQISLRNSNSSSTKFHQYSKTAIDSSSMRTKLQMQNNIFQAAAPQPQTSFSCMSKPTITFQNNLGPSHNQPNFVKHKNRMTKIDRISKFKEAIVRRSQYITSNHHQEMQQKENSSIENIE